MGPKLDDLVRISRPWVRIDSNYPRQDLFEGHSDNQINRGMVAPATFQVKSTTFGVDYVTFQAKLIIFLPIYVRDAQIYVHIPSGPPGETRIMDLDQYLEKMNTNTNVI